MEFMSEHFIPSERENVRLEHYLRYVIIQNIVLKKDVLDLACGEGYGSSLLADVAKSVNGMDLSEEFIRLATKTYRKTNLAFYQGDASSLKFPDASFDVVVSFETIKHPAEQKQTIAEVRRVLRPDGILIISSPNHPVYSERTDEHSDFHAKELDFNEFDDLLKTQFPSVQYYAQHLFVGSVIQSFTGEQNIYSASHNDLTSLIPKSGALPDPVCFIATASAEKTFLPEIDASITHPDNLNLVKQYASFAKWTQDSAIVSAEKEQHITNLSNETQLPDQNITSLNQSLSEQNEEIVRLKQLLSEYNTKIVELDAEIIRRGQQRLWRNAEIEELQQRLELVKDELIEERKNVEAVVEILNDAMKSNSWRLTLPLREARLWALKPGQQSKLYTKKILRLIKRAYQKLPFGIETIENHRNVFARYAPKLLQATETRLDGTEGVIIPSEESLAAYNVPEILQEKIFFRNPANYVENAKLVEICHSGNPLISVIIPVYGNIEYTLTCLASIAVYPPDVPFEVIVVDDCSPDNSFEVLENVKGIRLIKNDQNQGFILSCNAGASIALGEYLYFLNNDTQVTPGWADELLRTFYELPGTGLAGSKLIYSDGRLQEAGGIIWQDGSAWNFGRFQNPQLPIYNYAREVDYCSGASIMISRLLFEELGGFDENYLPAYCEDSDLALKIRDKGYRVIYQPLSTVIHYEGITSGTDTNEGAKSYQVENSKKLYSRWKENLLTHEMSGVDVDSAKDRRAKHRILVLENCTPTPNQDAGSVTVFNLLLLLREMDFQVTFIPVDNFLYVPEYTTALQRAGIEVLHGPYITNIAQHLEEYGERYDVAFLFRPDLVEKNIESVRKYCPQAKVLYYTHDLHFLRMLREAELFQDPEKFKLADEMKVREFDAINASDVSIVVSEQELSVIKNEFPEDKLQVLPLILNTPGTDKGFYYRQDIVYVGGFQHTPNIDAVKYFVSEIMPLLRLDLPGVNFYVVGSKPPEDIKALAADDVIITGFVKDLAPLLDKMRVSVAPLRFGAGVKGKIGTAMAAGLPVVATVIAAEGMSLTDGENVLVADNPEDFVRAIVKVYQSEELWEKISQEGLKFADKTWGAKAAWKALSDIISLLGIHAVHGKYPLSLYSEFNSTKTISRRPPDV